MRNSVIKSSRDMKEEEKGVAPPKKSASSRFKGLFKKWFCELFKKANNKRYNLIIEDVI